MEKSKKKKRVYNKRKCKKNNRFLKKISGFTVIELVASFVIIALLLGVGMISYSAIHKKAVESYYHTLESSLLLSGSDYFQNHREMLPANEYSKVSIKDLMDENYTDEVKDQNGNICLNGEVIIYKGDNNKYEYEVCLKCGDYESSGHYCEGYSVDSKRVRVPSNVLCKAKNKATYNGNAISLTIVDSAEGFYFEDYQYTNANEDPGYTIKAKLKDGYTWSDDTIEPKTFNCKLFKRNPTIELSSYSAEVVFNEVVKFKEKANIAGTFTNIVDNENVAIKIGETTISDKEKEVQIKGLVSNKSTTVSVLFEPSNDNKGNYNPVTIDSNIKFNINVINGVNKPTSAYCNNLTYNGKMQVLTKTPGTGYYFKYNEAIDADTYVVVAALEKGYLWKDNTSTEVRFECKINKKTITLNWTNENLIYNGKEQAHTPSVNTGVSGEIMNFTWTKGIDADSYTSSASCSGVSGGREKCDNYILSNTTNSYTISPRALSLSWTSESLTYNGKEQVHTPSVTTGVSGETMNLSWTKEIDAGNYTSTASCSGVSGGRGKCGNYTLSNTTNSYTISPRALSLSWTSESLTYNGKEQAHTPSATTGVSGETMNLSWTKGIDVGNYTSTASCSGVSGGRRKCDNYTLSNTTNSYTISPRTISLSWTSESLTYNGKEQAHTPSVTTGVSGETMSLNWTKEIDANSYTSTASCSGVSGGRGKCDNYTLTSTANKYTIDPKPLSVSWSNSNNEFTFNEDYQSNTPTTSTGVGGETISLSWNKGFDADSYTSIASCGSISGGRGKCSNYSLSNTSNSFKIVPSPTAELPTCTHTQLASGNASYANGLLSQAEVFTGGFKVDYTQKIAKTRGRYETKVTVNSKNYTFPDGTREKKVSCYMCKWGWNSSFYNGPTYNYYQYYERIPTPIKDGVAASGVECEACNVCYSDPDYRARYYCCPPAAGSGACHTEYNGSFSYYNDCKWNHSNPCEPDESASYEGCYDHSYSYLCSKGSCTSTSKTQYLCYSKEWLCL